MLTALTDAVASGPHGHWGPGPWWFVFPLLWFLLFATLIFLFARRARNGFGRGHAGPPPWAAYQGYPGYQATAGSDPVAILAERFARGEIDEPEFRSRLAALRSGAAPGTPPGGGQGTPPADA
ncbi:SHOCT domain-containing protein [Antribacter gilvus]|uniref:SHOCT domain-containing protein n=1 Tax=Antribacter gilvus TaxID=2304675 RepID=UPI000F78B998|nr:SHOCT domain-containing protein [Antribacter gilvus]